MLVLMPMKIAFFIFFLTTALIFTSCAPRDPQVLPPLREGGQGSQSFAQTPRWEDSFDVISSAILTNELERLAHLPNFIESLVSADVNLASESSACYQRVSWIGQEANKAQGRIQLHNCISNIAESTGVIQGVVAFELETITPGIQVYRLNTVSEAPFFLRIKGRGKTFDVQVSYAYEFVKTGEAISVTYARVGYQFLDKWGAKQVFEIQLQAQYSAEAVRANGALHFDALGALGERGVYFDLQLRSNQTFSNNQLIVRTPFSWCSDSNIQYDYRFDYKPFLRRTSADLSRVGSKIQIASRDGQMAPTSIDLKEVCPSQRASDTPYNILINPALFLVY